jgi:hypothetical protein
MKRTRPYLAVRKAGDCWEVQVCTPAPGRPLRTPAARYAVRSSARAHAEELAELTGLRLRRVGQ